MIRPIAWRQPVLQIAFFAVFIAGWEWFGRTQNRLLFAPFSESLAALFELARGGELFTALWESNQAMGAGFAAAVLLGIPCGLLLGRLPPFERLLNPYLNILIVTPMSAIVPLVIGVAGIGLFSRSLLVFAFAFPSIVINTRAGLKHIDPILIDMARSFGAGEFHLWRKVLLPGAGPAMLSGLRIGLGRALSGMVVSEFLLVAVGLGRLILRAMGVFEPEKVYAVIVVISAEAILLMNLARRVERRLLNWQEAG